MWSRVHKIDRIRPQPNGGAIILIEDERGIPLMSRDGRFDRKGLDAIARSYIDLHILDTAPDMSKLYTEAFLPK